MAYKDILNTFGGNTSYADRYQAAALKWDSNAMDNVARDYLNSQWAWTNQSTWVVQNVNNPQPAQSQQSAQSTQPTQSTQNQQSTQYNQWNGNLGNWSYWDSSVDRQVEIMNNLDKAYQQNPDQFKDWSTFSQNFNYNYAWRSDRERNTMRNWYEQNIGNAIDYNDINNTDYFFNQLMWWWQISWEWAALDAARNRYKNYQYLSGMTPDQIASAIASNSINPVWQEMQDLKNYSPALYAQVQADRQWQTQVNDINALWEWIYNWLTSTESNKNYTNYNFTTEYAKNAGLIKEYNESLYKKIEWLGWDTAAYVAIVSSMLQNPLIQANKDEVENIEWEIRKIQENIYTVWDTARSRLWSEAPEDLVSAYISQQTKELQNQLRTAQNSLLVAQGKLDNQLTEVDLMLDAINSWIKMYGEWWTTWWSNYQYVSGTKYQQAWYFNKNTWEFIPLWWSSIWTASGSWWTWWGWWAGGSTYVDTRDYQDDSAERLQEISNNLNKLLKSNPELFKDRSTFNNYFKYWQRSTKQKQILDAFWAKNKWIISNIWWWIWTSSIWTSDNGLVNAIKKDLISRTVNFSSSTMKSTYWWKYQQAKSLDEDTTNDYLQEIWKISSVGELKTMLWHLSKESNKKALLSSLKTKVKNELNKIEDAKERWNKIKEYANKLWVDVEDLANRWWIKIKTK